MQIRPDRLPVLIAAGLFTFALLLRLFGIGWGLPDEIHNQSFHPDEYLIWTQSQQVDPLSGSFKQGTGFYNYGTSYLRMLNVASSMTATYSGGPKEGDPRSTWDYVGRCNFAGRVMSALAGAGTVAVAFFLILRFSNLWGAVFGALLPAVAPGFVVHSRFQTVDVLATFFLACSALYAVKLVCSGSGQRAAGSGEDELVGDTASAQSSDGYKGPEPNDSLPAPGKQRASADFRAAILCGAFAGLSAGTKYTGILALLSLYVAILVIRSPKRFQMALAGTGAALLVFVLATPGALLDSAAFFRDFAYEMAHTSSGHGLLFEGTGSGFLYQLANLQSGLGILLAFASLGGLLYGLMRGPWRRYLEVYRSSDGPVIPRWWRGKLAAMRAFVTENPWAIVLFAFWLPYFILIGRAEVRFLRYTFPLYIGLAAGFGYLVAEGRKQGRWGHGLVALGILALGGFDYGGLRKTMAISTEMQGRDAREQAVLALREMQAKKPDLTVGFANDPWYYSPPTFADTGLFRAAPMLQATYAEMQTESKPKTLWYVPPEVLADPRWDQAKLNTRPRWDTRLLTELKPDYVAISNFEFYDACWRLDPGQPGLSESVRNEVTAAHQFMAKLKEAYVGYGKFGEMGDTVNDMMYVEPVVELWKRKDLP